MPHALQRQLVVEVDIRHQRDVDGPADATHGLRRRHIRHRHPDDIAPRLLQPEDLGHGGGHILRPGVAHGLDGDIRPAAYRDAAHMNLLAHG